jgi:hypothetical protein
MRPRTKGPRSVIVTMTLLPLLPVTRTLLPNGRERCAAVVAQLTRCGFHHRMQPRFMLFASHRIFVARVSRRKRREKHDAALTELAEPVVDQVAE